MSTSDSICSCQHAVTCHLSDINQVQQLLRGLLQAASVQGPRHNKWRRRRGPQAVSQQRLQLADKVRCAALYRPRKRPLQGTAIRCRCEQIAWPAKEGALQRALYAAERVSGKQQDECTYQEVTKSNLSSGMEIGAA